MSKHKEDSPIPQEKTGERKFENWLKEWGDVPDGPSFSEFAKSKRVNNEEWNWHEAQKKQRDLQKNKVSSSSIENKKKKKK